MERTFDRVPHFDDRSLAYRIRTLITPKPPKTHYWPSWITLDQGSVGACVGFAWTHLAASSSPRWGAPLTNDDALSLYERARQLDDWPGEDYEGSSTLGGAKASGELGRISSYHWAMTVDEIISALSYAGPVVIGINWYEGMSAPDQGGYLHVTGDVLGGHDIEVDGVNVTRRAVRLHNSWGASWGSNGHAWLSWDDLERLVIGEKGDCCLPVKIKRR